MIIWSHLSPVNYIQSHLNLDSIVTSKLDISILRTDVWAFVNEHDTYPNSTGGNSMQQKS